MLQSCMQKSLFGFLKLTRNVTIVSISDCEIRISVIYFTFVIGDASDSKDGGNLFHAGFAPVWKGLGWVTSLLSLHFFL